MALTTFEDSAPGASKEEAAILMRMRVAPVLRELTEICKILWPESTEEKEKPKTVSKYQYDLFVRGGRVQPHVRECVEEFYRLQLKELKRIIKGVD